MQHARTRVVYVLPSYDAATGSHFVHLYELLVRAAAELDILVVAERANGAPAGAPFRFRAERFAFPPFRLAELAAILLRERLSGARFAYVHYSLFGGVAAWLVFGLTGGRAYYWNCGMPWLYQRGRIEEAIFRFVLRHTILVTGTEGVRAEYCRRYGLAPAHTRVLPNWINVERFRNAANRAEARRALGIPEDAKVVLFVHRLSRRKGAHLLPDTISGVLTRGERAIFLIVGDGPERENLEVKVRGQGLGDRVWIVGEVPHRDIVNYFAAADVLLMPSEEEGFPHVLLEAMAAGLPYVASDVGGVREITPFPLVPFIVPPGDDAAFAEAVWRLVRLPADERAAIAAAMRETVQRYDVAAILPIFLRLFTP